MKEGNQEIFRKTIGDGITIVDAQNGLIEIDITSEDTNISPSTYKYEAELLLVDVDGNRYTAYQMKFVVYESLTKGDDL